MSVFNLGSVRKDKKKQIDRDEKVERHKKLSNSKEYNQDEIENETYADRQSDRKIEID